MKVKVKARMKMNRESLNGSEGVDGRMRADDDI